MSLHRFHRPASFASGWPSSRATANGPDKASRSVLNWPSVVLAALVAASAITVYMMCIPRLLGVEQMDIGIPVGRMADPSGGPVALLARLAWHLGNGMVYVFAYAAILGYFRKQSTAWTGSVFGVTLWLAGPMLLVPILLNLHPGIRSGALTNPGVFMLALGLGWKPALIDLGAHLTHGILVGVICTLHVAARHSLVGQVDDLPEPPASQRPAPRKSA
jgi:hypothetical protein